MTNGNILHIPIEEEFDLSTAGIWGILHAVICLTCSTGIEELY